MNKAALHNKFQQSFEKNNENSNSTSNPTNSLKHLLEKCNKSNYSKDYYQNFDSYNFQARGLKTNSTNYGWYSNPYSTFKLKTQKKRENKETYDYYNSTANYTRSNKEKDQQVKFKKSNGSFLEKTTQEKSLPNQSYFNNKNNYLNNNLIIENVNDSDQTTFNLNDGEYSISSAVESINLILNKKSTKSIETQATENGENESSINLDNEKGKVEKKDENEMLNNEKKDKSKLSFNSVHNFVPNNKFTGSVSDFDQQFNQLLPYFIQFKKENMYNNFSYEDLNNGLFYPPPTQVYDQVYMNSPIIMNNFFFPNFQESIFKPNPNVELNTRVNKEEPAGILNNYVSTINFNSLKEKFLNEKSSENLQKISAKTTELISDEKIEVNTKKLSFQEIKAQFEEENCNEKIRPVMSLRIIGKEISIEKKDSLFSKIAIFCRENKLSNKCLISIFSRAEKSKKILDLINMNTLKSLEVQTLLKKNSIKILEISEKRKIRSRSSIQGVKHYSFREQNMISRVI